VIQEAVALRLKSKTDQEGDSAIVVKQVLEQQDEQEQISTLRDQIEAEAEQQARSRFESLEFALKREIADLKAQLLQSATNSLGLVEKIPANTVLQETQASEPTDEIPATTGSQDAVASEPIESATGFQPSSFEQVALASNQLNEDIEIQVAELAPKQLSEHECDPAGATDCSELAASPSQPQSSDDSATDCQILAADWETIQQLRDAESSLQKIDAKIQRLNSPLAKSGSNTVVERELKHLRSLKVSEIVDLINSNGISGYYEELQNSCRVVLDPKYASAFLLQSKSWADVVLVVGSDGKQLRKSLKDWTLESKQLLVQLLSTYLEAEPNALGQIDWIPGKLIAKALSTLTFKIRKIGGPNNLVDEPKIEYISCDFVSLEYPGTDRERWMFRDSNNKNYAVFGRDEIGIERF